MSTMHASFRDTNPGADLTGGDIIEGEFHDAEDDTDLAPRS